MTSRPVFEIRRRPAPDSPRPARIFLAEDSRFDLRDFRRKMDRWSYAHEIDVATGGEAAIGRLLDRCAESPPIPPDIAILDLNLPKAHGVHVVSFIRQNVALKNLPVVVWTTSDSPFEISTAEGLRIEGYVQKTRRRHTCTGASKRRCKLMARLVSSPLRRPAPRTCRRRTAPTDRQPLADGRGACSVLPAKGGGRLSRPARRPRFPGPERSPGNFRRACAPSPSPRRGRAPRPASSWRRRCRRWRCRSPRAPPP